MQTCPQLLAVLEPFDVSVSHSLSAQCSRTLRALAQCLLKSPSLDGRDSWRAVVVFCARTEDTDGAGTTPGFARRRAVRFLRASGAAFCHLIQALPCFLFVFEDVLLDVSVGSSR